MGHVFEGFALGFRNAFPDEDGGGYTDAAVEEVGEYVTELRVRRNLHIVQRQEGRRNDEVEDPLEGHGDGYAGAANRVRENLGDEHPADRAPAEHK